MVTIGGHLDTGRGMGRTVRRSRRSRPLARRVADGFDALVVCHGSPYVDVAVLEAAPRLKLIGELEGVGAFHTEVSWTPVHCVPMLLATAILVIVGGLSAWADPAPTPSPANSDPRLDELAVLVNRARVDHAVFPLARSQQLDAAAQAHSLDMVANNYLDHVGSDTSTPQERAERAGYVVPPRSGWIVVEVISAISDEPAGPLNWWLTEPTGVHRRVVLNPRWRESGVGYAAGGDYGNYWTLLVGCRPAVLPVVTLDATTYVSTELCA